MPDDGTGCVPKRSQGVVEKCTFCSHRVEQDLDPACVDACPADARIFGDLDDEESTVSKYVTKYETHRLLEDLETKPSTYYVRGEMTPGRQRVGKELEGTERKDVAVPDGGDES